MKREAGAARGGGPMGGGKRRGQGRERESEVHCDTVAVCYRVRGRRRSERGGSGRERMMGGDLDGVGRGGYILCIAVCVCVCTFSLKVQISHTKTHTHIHMHTHHINATSSTLKCHRQRGGRLHAWGTTPLGRSLPILQRAQGRVFPGKTTTES